MMLMTMRMASDTYHKILSRRVVAERKEGNDNLQAAAGSLQTKADILRVHAPRLNVL